MSKAVRKWTKEEEDILIEMYNSNTNKEIAKVLNRTPNAIRGRLYILGLTKSSEWRSKINAITNNGAEALKNRALPVGSERRGDGYVEIKIGENEWVRKHRYIYVKAHGEIPEGYVVTFKDGNSMNCEIDNLKLATYAEIMLMNRNDEKSAKSLRETLRREKLLIKYGLKQNTKRKLVNIY